MIKELAWYLESGRFTNLVNELEASLKQYERAKQAGQEESVVSPLRENARTLFEDHCVRCGLRDSENSFINIDAEFFSGNSLDEEAVNSFIKNIIKGHCYQKVLWTYMGTTGSFTVISKAEMAKEGFRYDNYLPLEYKNNRRIKKPYEDIAGKSNELFYMYGDGRISKEYIPEKAKFRLNALEDQSGIDWKAGYDPNGRVKKDGWHGSYDHSGTWIRREGTEAGGFAGESGSMPLELIKNGDTAILYDPGMILLSSPMLMYLTEQGEPYGNLEMDREQTIADIRGILKEMGVSAIGAVGGIVSDKPEVLSAYREVLQELSVASLEVMDTQTVVKIKEAQENNAQDRAAQRSGVELEKKLLTAGIYGGTGEVMLATLQRGSMAVPLSPRKRRDALVLGLAEKEIAALESIPVGTEYEREYDTVLSNIYAAWEYYESSGLSKVETARVVKEYFEKKSVEASRGGASGRGNNCTLPVISVQAGLEEIIFGAGERVVEGTRLYSSGIPGVFKDLSTIDFYSVEEKAKYIKRLERKRVLPKGGGAAALEALKTLPIVDEERKVQINRGLTRALGQYRAISMSTGLPIAELIEAVKTGAVNGAVEVPAVMGRKVWYELPMEELLEAAQEENHQVREERLEEAMGHRGASEIIIGGLYGLALDEVALSRERLMGAGISEEEAQKVEPFLHSIRFASEAPVVPVFLLEVLKDSRIRSAASLRQTILEALDSYRGASYNLSSREGLQAYVEGGRAKQNKISKKELGRLVREHMRDNNAVPVSAGVVTSIKPRYKVVGSIVPLTRSTPRGRPEEIRPAHYEPNVYGGSPVLLSRESQGLKSVERIDPEDSELQERSNLVTTITPQDSAGMNDKAMSESTTSQESQYQAVERERIGTLDMSQHAQRLLSRGGKLPKQSGAKDPVALPLERQLLPSGQSFEQADGESQESGTPITKRYPQNSINHFSGEITGEAMAIPTTSDESAIGFPELRGSDMEREHLRTLDMSQHAQRLVNGGRKQPNQILQESQGLKSVERIDPEDSELQERGNPVTPIAPQDSAVMNDKVMSELAAGTKSIVQVSELPGGGVEHERLGTLDMSQNVQKLLSSGGKRSKQSGAGDSVALPLERQLLPSGQSFERVASEFAEKNVVPLIRSSPQGSPQTMPSGLDFHPNAPILMKGGAILSQQSGAINAAALPLERQPFKNGQSFERVTAGVFAGGNGVPLTRSTLRVSSEANRAAQYEPNVFVRSGRGGDASPLLSGLGSRQNGAIPESGEKKLPAQSRARNTEPLSRERRFLKGGQSSEQVDREFPELRKPIIERPSHSSFEVPSGKITGHAMPIPTTSKETKESEVKFAGQGGRDVELERLRKIEVNYEKDKAMLAKEKVSALARSESHEIGHAEGERKNDSMTPQTIATASRELVGMIKKSTRRKLGE